MKHIFVVCEGQAEAAFVKRILAPYFPLQDKILIPVTAVTKLDKKRGKMHKGEMSNFEKARSKITQALAGVRDSHKFMKLIFKSLLLTSSNLNCS